MGDRHVSNELQLWVDENKHKLSSNHGGRKAQYILVAKKLLGLTAM